MTSDNTNLAAPTTSKALSGGLTVYDATYNLLRKLGLTTIFGNPGSTEQPFLKNFPPDFQYILALQEASAVAMADGFAQATRKPVLLNLHTNAGTGNGMGNIMTAFLNKTPLIITAGQQHREMLLSEPMLTNRDETMMARPYVKWSYQPARAQDVPAAIMRAYAIALQPPAGPVFLSIPLDDWDRPALGEAVIRSVSTRYAPDPDRIEEFAQRIREAKRPALIYGQEIERSGGWDAAVKFAEQLRAPVFLAPNAERASFPQDHPQFQGMLPIAIATLGRRLKGYDLVIVIGAPIFRYYPYIAGEYLPEGTALLQITADPNDAGAAAVGDSLLSDAKLALDALLELVPGNPSTVLPSRVNAPIQLPNPPSSPLTPNEAFSAISELRPDNAILLQESPSNFDQFLHYWPITQPDSYYTYASGALGWNTPAAVGVALAQQKSGSNRPVIALIGDGSLQYSVQSLYTAAQHRLKLIYIVPCNGEYAILKEFAVLEKTPNVPALDLPGLDIVATGKAYGCAAVEATTRDEIKEAFAKALQHDGPTVIAIPISRELRTLLGTS